MLTAVVTGAGPTLAVTLVGEGGRTEAFVTAEEKEIPESDLNPLSPEPKEIIWGFGAFVVLALLMRYVLFPKLRSGMHARDEKISGDRERAEATTASARADVAEYEAQVATIRAEAQQRVDAARATLEAERTEKIAAANAEIADRRSAAMAEVEAARTAAQSDVESAVVDVVTRGVELATGQSATTDQVSGAVRTAMGAEVSR